MVRTVTLFVARHLQANLLPYLQGIGAPAEAKTPSSDESTALHQTVTIILDKVSRILRIWKQIMHVLVETLHGSGLCPSAS